MNVIKLSSASTNYLFSENRKELNSPLLRLEYFTSCTILCILDADFQKDEGEMDIILQRNVAKQRFVDSCGDV